MLGNDISNRQAPILAFCIDNLVIEEKEEASKLSKYLPKILRREKTTYKIDEDYVNLINHIWNNYSYSIYFVTFHREKQEFYYELLDTCNVNYTSLEVNHVEAIRRSCLLQYTYYFDNDEELLSYISMSNALHYDKLKFVIR